MRDVRRLVVALVLGVVPAVAWGDTGSEAFAREDYAAALELWQTEAEAGSAQARFGLGLIHDLGLGVPRDPAVAFQWYLSAARDGFSDAQLNVAVMLDAGTGAPRDPEAAAVWYGRAAANGQARAQYNLGLLYELGMGVPRNPDLARVWYEAASPDLVAAADRLALLPPEEARDGSVPRTVVGAIVGPPDRPRAELVWTADAGGDAFRVQVARRLAGDAADVPDRDGLLLSGDVERTAIVIDLPVGEADLVWRIGRVGGAEGVSPWSAWTRLSREAVPEEPSLVATANPDRLTILVSADDPLAGAFAAELSDTFARGGLDVTVQGASQPASATTVEYRYANDAELAVSVAEFMPGLGADDAVQVASLDTAPGEVTLRLVGGPGPSGAEGAAAPAAQSP